FQDKTLLGMTKKKIEKAIKFWQDNNEQEAINLLEKLNLEENSEANTLLGKIYLYAEQGRANIERNPKKGIKFLEKGLNLGDSDAGLELAEVYYLGDEVKQNLKTAENYWTKSWSMGNIQAGFELANFYFDERNNKIEKAIKIYEELIKRNENIGNCYSKLSRIYEYGIGGINPDSEKSMLYLEKGAEVFDIYCCPTLALKYYRGDNIEKNSKKAISLLKKVKNNDLFRKEINILLEKMTNGEKI
ncbi:sel1 repeat family protein, partial [Polaribacter vadi]|uniref:tetratricopeptide repeat protein n=1 Tax=Polaribacter TaxID=52959 RepID=UPI001C08ACA9